MAIRLLNLRAEPPRDMVPVCVLKSFRDYWEPGARALGLELVPQFGVLAINGKNKNTNQVLQLVEELSKLRAWFIENVPVQEQGYLLERLDHLTHELKEISREEIIDFTIG